MDAAGRSGWSGRGAVGKSLVVGVKDLGTNEAWAEVAPSPEAPTLPGFVRENMEPGTTVYTDESASHAGSKHLDRCVAEFAGLCNVREADTPDRVAGVAVGVAEKRLRYGAPTAGNGPDPGARS